MNYINQGTVLYGMRSEKYPEKMCYAVIISARCDIANNKITKLYYLIAVNAKDWFCSENGFFEVYGKWLEEKKHNFINKYKDYKLNFELLLSMPCETAINILDGCEENERKKRKLTEEYKCLYQIVAPLGREERKAIVKENPKNAIRFLKEITAGHTYHYFFLPQNVYQERGAKDEGLVVDLQEIEIMPITDVKCLKSPGIDFQTLSEKGDEEQLRLKKKYWLENDEDFVEIDGVVQSPWCELLMQRFANDFIRIGVDGSTDSDFAKLIDQV